QIFGPPANWNGCPRAGGSECQRKVHFTVSWCQLLPLTNDWETFPFVYQSARDSSEKP
ncbi:hypothetical protein chiPu_0023673, partial [Chiloscyllium punctatum]|nr:hypothetical protein [Chiloscyllium punctatum]